MTSENSYIENGKMALLAEAKAIELAANRIGADFNSAVDAILKSNGKVVVTGMGKSGHIARKTASTLSSTGTSSFFVHPSEALHGDFGMLQSTDVLIAIAYGGETHEVIEFTKFARRIGVPIISITGKIDSSLAQLANHSLNGSIEREADPLNLAPTTSSTLAMALGDALAVALMTARGFTSQDFAALHPGGKLGKKLSQVSYLMKSGELPIVSPSDSVKKVLSVTEKFNYGIVAVIENDQIMGAISDGDLRRGLRTLKGSVFDAKAEEVMTKNPRTTIPSTLALDAVRIMNEGSSITQLFVVDPENEKKLLGIICMPDLFAAKIV
jgi:arabinose-5-phosphate isomerase